MLGFYYLLQRRAHIRGGGHRFESGPRYLESPAHAGLLLFIATSGSYPPRRTSVRVRSPLLRKPGIAGLFCFYMFTVYVLYSEAYHKHYTGFSNNFEARLLSHNLFGKKDWAARYRPWKVILTEEYALKEDALKREKWLKTGVGREFISKLPH